MKKNWIFITLLATTLASAPVALTGCSQKTKATDRALQYTCPMHPEIVQDKPGTCPKCGMKLVEKK